MPHPSRPTLPRADKLLVAVAWLTFVGLSFVGKLLAVPMWLVGPAAFVVAFLIAAPVLRRINRLVGSPPPFYYVARAIRPLADRSWIAAYLLVIVTSAALFGAALFVTGTE